MPRRPPATHPEVGQGEREALVSQSRAEAGRQAEKKRELGMAEVGRLELGRKFAEARLAFSSYRFGDLFTIFGIDMATAKGSRQVEPEDYDSDAAYFQVGRALEQGVLPDPYYVLVIHVHHLDAVRTLRSVPSEPQKPPKQKRHRVKVVRSEPKAEKQKGKNKQRRNRGVAA